MKDGEAVFDENEVDAKLGKEALDKLLKAITNAHRELEEKPLSKTI